MDGSVTFSPTPPFVLVDPMEDPLFLRIDAALRAHNPRFRERIFGTDDGWDEMFDVYKLDHLRFAEMTEESVAEWVAAIADRGATE